MGYGSRQEVDTIYTGGRAWIEGERTGNYSPFHPSYHREEAKSYSSFLHPKQNPK